MDMQGQRQLGVTQQQAWDALNDPEVLKACIPGCERITATAADAFEIGLALRIGPVAARFTGKIKLQNIQPPSSYTLEFEGQGGPAGFGKGSAQVQLTPAEGGCQLDYTAKAQVGGKVAQLGQRLIDGAAKSLAEDFFKRFDAHMQSQNPAPATASAAGTSQAGQAKGIAQRVPPWAAGVATFALGFGAWVLLHFG